VIEGRTVWSPDFLADPGIVVPDWLRERAKATGHRAVVGVPLVVRGETVGALSLGDVAGRRMTDAELRLVSAFADQAALALHNARMFAETTARLRETETLLEVARAFSSPLSVEEAMRHVTAAVARRFGADMAGAYFLDATKELLVPLAGYHVPTDLLPTLLQTPFPISRFKILREAWDTRKPVWTSAYESDHRFDQGFLADRRPRSLLFAPTPVRGEIVGGLFLVWWASERSFTPAELRLMEGVASQVGLALENADLDRQTQDKLRETELFAELAKTVNAALDLDTVLQRVADAARELCGSDRAMIAIHDAASDAMVVRYRAGPRADAYRNRRVEPGHGVGGQVLLTGRPFRTSNYAEDPRVTKEYLQWAPEDATVAAVAVPIRIGDSIEGLLYAQNLSPRPFGDHHEAILLRLADHAAIAITNARLFAREQAARADAEAALLALRVSEERYRAVVDGSIQGMYIHQDRIIRFANEAMVRTFRYENAAELVGQDYLIFLAPEEHERIEGYRAARLRGEPAPTRYETRGRCKDGAPIWIEILVSIVSWEGRPAVLGTFLDITERKRAEATEREALALRSVTQLANAAAHEINNPLSIIVGHLEILSRDVDLHTGARPRLEKALGAADRVRAIVAGMAHITRLRSANDPPGLPVRLDLAESTGVPRDDDAGAVSNREARLAAVVDRLREHVAELERRQAETHQGEGAWRENYALLEKAQEVAHVGYWVSATNASGRLLWSAETYRIFGIPEGGFDGRVETFFELVHPDDREAVRRASEAALGSGGHYRIDHRIVRPDGTVRWVHEEADITRDAGAPRILGVVQDITERKHAEEERRQLEDQLRQAQKMEAIGALAGGIAHDFNNLLTVIIGRARLLETRVPPEERLRRDLDLIEKAAGRAAGLTKQLLAFSRKQVLEPSVLDLNAVVANMEPMLRRLITEDIDLTVVPGAGLLAVRAEAGQLGQVLMNLVVNARDAMPHGGRVTLETASVHLDEAFAARHPGARTGPHVRLSVTDTGVGMSEQTKSHIFEPFFTTKEEGRGTGLGLSTVYGIVKQHGAYVAVESALGRGACFTIYLPRVEMAVEPAPPAGEQVEAPRGSETILVVEDEQGVRELAQEVLEAQGYRVLEARHPGEALLLGERYAGRIHLVVTDLMMPQMDGFELSERLRVYRPEIKVLYISAYSDALIARSGRLPAGTPVLEKPFLPDVLSRTVREVLDAG
jgi:two-component system, cell cycle sensor histidine kinase and response regulator CckA